MKPETIEKVEFFMKKNQTKYQVWDSSVLRGYVQWIERYAAFGIVWNKGEIVGVGIARPLALKDIEAQSKDHYALSPNGDVLFVDSICATTKRAIPILWGMMVSILGPRPFFAGCRHGKLRMWKFDKYQLKILKGE